MDSAAFLSDTNFKPTFLGMRKQLQFFFKMLTECNFKLQNDFVFCL